MLVRSRESRVDAARREAALSRRTFLRGAGIAIALPWLEALRGFGAESADVPRRMVAIETNMGILPQFFFPEQAGREYTVTPYLEKLAAVRDRMTVFSGCSFPGVSGGHAAEKCFLTGTPHPDRGGFRNGVSLDQVAAEEIGDRTRFPSLTLAMSVENQSTLSYTRSGAPIPAQRSPAKLFKQLFLQGSADETAANVEALRQGRSLLDFVGDQAKRLRRDLPVADRQRLEAYDTSVRELERRLEKAEAWEHKPKPVVAAQPPEDVDDQKQFALRTRLFCDVMKLALETDSTRVITLFVDTTVLHPITHHGNRPEVLAELRRSEESQFDVLAGFLRSLLETKEAGQTLLDRTMVLYGTCMGSANSHATTNLPVLLAGGEFKHAGHLAFDTENNYPLTNLHLTMLHRLGIEVDRFSSSTGTFRGLELA
jgi:hypothetical protein